GILNIILKQHKTLGLNGSVTTSIGIPITSQITTNLNLRTNKYNIFSTLGYSYQEPPGSGYFDHTYANGEFSRIIEDRDIERKNKGFNVNLGMEYFLTDRSSITGSVFGRFSDEQDATENTSERFIESMLDSRTFRGEVQKEDDKSYQFSLNYTNNFNENGHKLTADFQYSNDKEKVTTTIDDNMIFPEEDILRSEERRVGKERTSRGAMDRL